MNPRFLFTSRLKGKIFAGDLDYQGEGDDVNENLASIRGLSKTIQPKFTMYYGLIQQGKRILI